VIVWRLWSNFVYEFFSNFTCSVRFFVNYLETCKTCGGTVTNIVRRVFYSTVKYCQKHFTLRCIFTEISAETHVHRPSCKVAVKHDPFFLICIVGGGVQTGSTRHVGHLLAYCTCPGRLWGCRIWWNEWQEKPNYSKKTCPDATLSTTNPTWPDPGLNPGRRGGKPATNRFSYGAAYVPFKIELKLLDSVFEELPNIYPESPSRGSRVYTCGRTEGQTDRNSPCIRSCYAHRAKES
jgi:hypothetical protein